MSAEPRFTAAPTRELPSPATLFGRIDRELRSDAQSIAVEIEAAARAGFPKRTGRTAASARAAVRQSRRGFGVVLSVGRPGQSGERAHVVRFLERGTGTRGPQRRRIPADRRGRLRDGRVPSGAGQRPQRSWTRALRAVRDEVMPSAERTMREAWERATSSMRARL